MDRDEFKGKDLYEQNLELFDLLNEILEKLNNSNVVPPLQMPVTPGVPVPPYIPPTPNTPDPLIKTGGVGCSKCGLKIEGTGGYVCGRSDCSMGGISYVNG